MKNPIEKQTPCPEEASYGGYHFRMEYEEMERKTKRSARFWENIVVSIGFGAVVILVTMVLVSVGASII